MEPNARMNPPTTTSPPPDAKPRPFPNDQPKKKPHGWIWFLVFLVIALSGYFFYTRNKHGAAPAKAPSAAANRAIPVVAATASLGNMGVYLTGLGTVTAFNTVTVRTRVDGELIKVAFEEGQFVHQGELLAEIDPRPFQVQLEQAEGQMARDQAGLNNSKVDLSRYQVLIGQDA